MQKITLEINNSIYEYIMFFLENIPKNLVNIKKELQVKAIKDTESSNSFNPRDFFGVTSSSKIEIDNYLQENQNEWDSYIVKR
ncbi:MAG TPA: hypothetical protein EYG73_01915 [Arcobacter sp.]|nr:hypothetical protein [Arcobacter sp.]